MRFCAVLLLLAFASPAGAQNGVKPPQGWSLGLSAGGTAYTDFQRGDISTTRLSLAGLEQREYPQRVGAQTSGSITGHLAYWPNANWGLRVYGVYSPSRFKTIISRSAAEFSGEPRMGADSTTLAGLNITSYQGQAVFRLPAIRGRIMPYGLLGAGAVHYDVRNRDLPVPEEARGAFASGTQTRFAGSLGAGAMINMRRRGWGLNFEMIDQLSRTPVEEGPVRLLSTLSFTIGLSLRLSGR